MKPSEAMTFIRQPRQHQLDAFDRFAYEKEVALFWEMGTGKTTEAILWLRAKYNLSKAITPTLIISPVATLYNWLEEFKLNAPEKVVNECFVPYMRTRRTKYIGNERAAEIRNSNKKILILHPESLDNDNVLAAIKQFSPKNFVLDEAHKFKSYHLYSGNGKIKKPSRPEKLRSITRFCENRMIMTGTPFLNGYLDVWSQFYILDNGKTFGDSYYLFRDTYFEDENLKWRLSGKKGYFQKYIPKKSCDEQVAKLLEAKSSRLTKEECLDLPPLVIEKYHVELGKEQAEAYDSMEKELIAEVNGGTCAAINALSKVNRLMQILSGHLPVEVDFDPEKVMTYFKDNPRMDAAKELLTDLTPTHKVILWVGFRANYPKIREMLASLGLQWAELIGGTKDRQGEINRFQNDPKCRVIMSNKGSGGVGVNLTAASYSIDYSYDYKLADWLQGLARNHRGGSEIHKKITAIVLVAPNTINEKILDALMRKENFSDSVLDRLKS